MTQKRRRTRDPLVAVAALHKASAQWQAEADALRVERDEAIRRADAEGHAQTAIAAACGLSPAAVRRVLAERPDA